MQNSLRLRTFNFSRLMSLRSKQRIAATSHEIQVGQISCFYQRFPDWPGGCYIESVYARGPLGKVNVLPSRFYSMIRVTFRCCSFRVVR